MSISERRSSIFTFSPFHLLLFLWEPAFFHSFSLLEELQNRPEARETEHAKQHRKVDALYEKRPDATGNSEHEKHWPAVHAEVVFSLNDDRVEEADANIHKSMELQLQVAEDTSLFQEEYIMMVMNLPMIEYTETIERIFSSNIETINTIGNVFFTEKVAEFYNLRQHYKKNISDSIYNRIIRKKTLSTLDDFLGFNYYLDAIMSNSLTWDMRRLYGLCQQMMNVTDEEIEAYIKKRETIEESVTDIRESKLSAMDELKELSTKINTARERLK